MTRASDIYKGSDGEWLKYDDLQGKARRVTLGNFTIEEMRDIKNPDQTIRKAVFELEGYPKLWVVNATSANNIEAAYGDLEDWPGKRVILKPHIFGKDMKGILGEPADVEVSDGFESPPVSKPIQSVVDELAGKFEEDSDMPF